MNNTHFWTSAWRRSAAVALLAAAIVCPAAAEDSLDRIARSGRIVLGAHDAAVPISYLGPDGQHIGYQLDLCGRIVNAIRQRLNLPQLRSTTVPIKMATHTAMLNNGTVDMDCGPNPINDSSQRLSALTYATLAYELTLMTTTEKRQLRLADFNGRSVGVIGGAPAVPRLRAAARDGNFQVTEVIVRDGDDAFEAFADGRIDALMAPLPYLLAMRSNSPKPERYVALDIPLGRMYAGIAFRSGDESLRKLANEVIVALAGSGEMERLYERWFMQPIPGLRRSVGAAMTDMQRAIFDAPGSEANAR